VTRIGRKKNESKSFREADVRKMQGHQEKRQGHGDLRESEAQAEAGLIADRQKDSVCIIKMI
jgi:hypothetical protein